MERKRSAAEFKAKAQAEHGCEMQLQIWGRPDTWQLYYFLTPKGTPLLTVAEMCGATNRGLDQVRIERQHAWQMASVSLLPEPISEERLHEMQARVPGPLVMRERSEAALTAEGKIARSVDMKLVEFVTRFYAPALTEHQLDLLRRIDQDRMVEGELALQQKRLALANCRRMTPIPLLGQIGLVAFDEASEVPDAVWARAAVEPAGSAALPPGTPEMTCGACGWQGARSGLQRDESNDDICPKCWCDAGPEGSVYPTEPADMMAACTAHVTATSAPEIHCTECGWEGRYDDMIDGPPADPTAYRCPRCDRQSDDCMADGAYPGATSAPGALDAAIAASSSIDQAAPAAKDLRVETPEEKEVERKRLADFFAKNGVL